MFDGRTKRNRPGGVRAGGGVEGLGTLIEKIRAYVTYDPNTGADKSVFLLLSFETYA